MSLAGKVVLVTGAGSGIGRAVAKHLSRGAASVVIMGRRDAALRQTQRECRAIGSGPPPETMTFCTDIGHVEDVDSAVSAALDRFGRIDGLVNNAGVARFAPIEDVDLDDLEAMLDANLRGPIHLVRACLPSLRESNGAIVNVSSVGGVVAMPGRSLYGATKAAITSLTRSLARELAPEVRVNAVLPGPVETPMYDDLGLSDDATRRLRAELVEATPMGRFGQPDEVAHWVCSLLDEDVSAWITGTLMSIDGGRTA